MAGKVVSDLFTKPLMCVFLPSSLHPCLHFNVCQAEDRAHRIGQKDSVLIEYLICKGTTDDHVWPLILGKMEVLSKLGLCADSFQDMQRERQSQMK